MSSPGAQHASAPSRRQKRMGPAPFASFEDLSDELDSPEDKNASGAVVRLPGIREDVTPCSPAPQEQPIRTEFLYTGISLIGAPSTPTVSPPSLPVRMNLAPTAPRIDISRASSSSHHDSKDSSPEREETAPTKAALGFREDDTQELRNSTEELDYQEQHKKTRAASPVPHEESYHSHNRKDSQSSEIGLLCISGRTSRLSSIGSQGSAHSRVSNASHLSVISGQSGVSRSPSPHKMLLETSFCGTKQQKKTQSVERDDGTKDDMEKVLLQRKHDPTQVLIAEGITVETPKPEKRKAVTPIPVVVAAATPPPPPPPREIITIKVDKPTNDIIKSKLPKHIVSESGTEYIYIPLKGPLPEDTTGAGCKNGAIQKTKVRETKSASTITTRATIETKQISKSATPSPIVGKRATADEPKYIRIKLKPDHLYGSVQQDDDDDDTPPTQKPDTLDFHETPKKTPQTFEQIMSYRESPQHITPVPSPKSRHLKEPSINKSPSPSLSRKSSFASIFKSRETISPDSPTTIGRSRKTANERRRSRSKSRDRTSLAPSSTESIDSKGRQKSVFSIFKTKTKGKDSPDLPNLETLVKSENGKSPLKPTKYYDTPLDGDSVRIPLHSPTYYEQKHILQDFKTSSQDSQETVIEVVSKPKESNNRQSSTSSENLVFSTRLGSNNDLFTTKIPKDKVGNKFDEITTAIVETQRSPVLEEDYHPEPASTLEESVITAIKTLSPDIRKILETNEFIITPSLKPPTPPPTVEMPSTSTVAEEPITMTVKIVDRKDEGPAKPTVVSLEIKRKPTTPEVPQTETCAFETSWSPQEDAAQVVCIENTPTPKRDDDRYSSESERDSEVDKKEFANESVEQIEPERKGLVLQQDSFEDEFPYIPTTLPQERSVAVPIVPVKQRSAIEMKTCPIDRPRSTTPINPTCLEDYRANEPGDAIAEKLKICLPRDEDRPPKTARSPRRTSSSNWFDFSKVKPEIPPLPPVPQKEWINFEEIPERRKAPKRIQTIPSRSNIEVPEPQDNVIYTYVNPEDCKCECHERVLPPQEQEQQQQQQPLHDDCDEVIREDEMPLLEDEAIDEERVAPASVKLDVTILDRRSIVSDSSLDLSTNADGPNTIDHSLRTPFTSDLGVSSNRSSIISQEDIQSPDTDSPNAFSRTTS